MKFEAFWLDCVAKLKQELSPLKFKTLIQPLSVELGDDGAMILVAPNTFVLDLLQKEKLSLQIEKWAHEKWACVDFILRVVLASAEKTQPTPIDVAASAPASKSSSLKPNGVLSKKHKKTNLDNQFTFETLVVGKGNQLAHAIALQITENPGDAAYNPLFVYGGVGVGKTHLIQAIGNQIYQKNPQANVRYIHAKEYIEDIMKAYRRHAFDDFKDYYNAIDLLLIDDIQFLAGKNRSMEEFFYIFNTLLENQKQVIMTCDTFPKKIEQMDTRLISRFSWGLTVQIEPAELEMRVAILLKKAEIASISLNSDVAFFVAQHVRANGRELEGALKRIKAFTDFHRKSITIELAKEALKDIIAASIQDITIDLIQKTVADFYKIPLLEMGSKKRVRIFTKPRQVAMLLAKELTPLSLPSIGKAFGGRDHTTVLHACHAILEKCQYDQMLSKELDTLLAILQH